MKLDNIFTIKLRIPVELFTFYLNFSNKTQISVWGNALLFNGHDTSLSTAIIPGDTMTVAIVTRGSDDDRSAGDIRWE